MNTLDCAMFLFWALLCVFNTAALLPLFSLSVFAICFSLFDANFPIFCVTAITYIELAKVNINISSQLRYAFLAMAGLYWCGAIDELLYNQIYDYAGVYYDVMPYFVIAINAYIAALLYKDGGRNIVGIIARLRSLARNCLHRIHGI